MSREAEVAHEGEEHHKSTLDRLIYMGNQIGWFFRSQPAEKAVLGILDHVQHFWDPRMRKEIFRHIDETGGERIEPLVLEALIQLKAASDLRTGAGKVETGQPRTGESAAADQQGAQASPSHAATKVSDEETVGGQ